MTETPIQLRQRTIKVGDLVKIVRPSVGVTKDTLALITDFFPAIEANDIEIWRVQLLGGRIRRYLKRDLEVVE